MAQRDRLDTAQRAFEAMGHGIVTGDFEPFAAYLADDIVLTFFGTTKAAGTFQGKPLVIRWFRGVHKYFPEGLAFSVRNAMASADAAAIEWEDRGVTTGGRLYENHGVSIFEFRGDTVSAYREYIDTERVKAFF